MRTLAEALRLAAAELLDAEPRDIRASKELRDGRPLVVLSDAVAGGAGYVQRIIDDPAFSAQKLISAAVGVLDCRRPDCASSCSQCLNDYSNQAYWDQFDRHPVLSWLNDLLRQVTNRPSHSPERSIPVKDLTLDGLHERVKGASDLSIVAATLPGARDAEHSLAIARFIRDFCEADAGRTVRLVVSSGLPLGHLSTLDRAALDLLAPLEGARLAVTLGPRQLLETGPRISIRKGDTVHELYGDTFDQPILDGLLQGDCFVAAGPYEGSWLVRNASGIEPFESALAAPASGTQAFRYDPGDPRDFKAMFGTLSGRSVRLTIEDPYLASGDRNRAALTDFLSKLHELDITLALVTLFWRPSRPGSGWQDERPEDQQRDLVNRLKAIGLSGGRLMLKPRHGGRSMHFHDRTITASVVDDVAKASYRWDVTSGIDNLMERQRQCSVFLTVK